ncbi:hypothetical protein QWY90_01360 [Flavobacterium paronense]|nr:hypothetical protein [Flavobacterium paronense]MDN3675958.1 hypothetical protein [Flavobacterium paronense]
MEYTQKHWKPEERIEVAEDLPLNRLLRCPLCYCLRYQARYSGIHPSAWRTRYADALELIYQRNALPAITGHICDHQCQYNCTRLDYDSALNIRELKKVALEKGWDEYKQRWHKPAGFWFTPSGAVMVQVRRVWQQVTSLPERAIRYAV